MKYRVLQCLLTLVTSLVIGNSFAVDLTQKDLVLIFGEEFAAKQTSINKIIKAPPELAAEVLAALQDENLFSNGQIVVIKTKEGYIDPISQTIVTVDESTLESPNLNNILRSDIETSASQFKLLSKDTLVREQSLNALIADTTGLNVAIVKSAKEKETKPELITKFNELIAILDYSSSTQEEKLKAIQTMGNSSSDKVQEFLKSLLKKNDSGEFVEPNKNLRVAIELALHDYQSRKSRSEIVSNIFTGLSLGSVLLLAAMGLAITYGLIGVINMAHGEFLMVGAYATFIVQTVFRNHFPGGLEYYLVLAAPFSFLTAAFLGLVLEYLVLRHLYGRPLETLLATFGVSLLMMQFVRFLFGAQNVEVANPSWMSGSFMPLQSILPGLLIPYNRLIIFFFSLFVVFITWIVLNKTRMGLFVRAVTQNRTMASCVGVRTRQVDSYAFAFGAGIAGLGGCALSQIGNVGPDLGQTYIIDSFMVVVLGGVGQLAGTILGAFGLGILSKFSEPFIGAVLTKIGVLVMIILFIQKRPQGMFALKGRSAEQ
jgi:urea transport system permease protein